MSLIGNRSIGIIYEERIFMTLILVRFKLFHQSIPILSTTHITPDKEQYTISGRDNGNEC